MDTPMNRRRLAIAFLFAAATFLVTRLDLNMEYTPVNKILIAMSADVEEDPLTIQELNSSRVENSTLNVPPDNQSLPEDVGANATISYEQPNGKPLWIYVNFFSEGMAAWRTSLAEILMVAKKFNATVVEPCIDRGYLRACDDYTVRLNQVYDVSELRKFYPHIVSHEDYQTMLAAENPVIVPICFQNPRQPYHVARTCSNWTNMYDKDVTPLLERARQQNNGTTLIYIHYYRPGGFRGTRVGGELIPDFLNETGLIIAKYFLFARQHYDMVDYLLQLMGISNTSDFDVIHWRAETPNIDFDDCATKILQARKAMGSNTTVLMSSINQHDGMQWFKLDKSNQSDAVRSVDRLLDSGFHKLDQVLDKVRNMIPDKIVLPVWDQIIAQKAQRFATCIKGCAQTNDLCVACNWPGSFAQATVNLRTQIGKSSYECWPT